MPSTPLALSGGVARPLLSSPQHATLPVSASIAQLCVQPPAMADASPAMPFTLAGTADGVLFAYGLGCLTLGTRLYRLDR